MSVADAPDYYAVIKNPVDLSLIRKRVGQAYYVTPHQLQSELYIMCENCRLYNDPSTGYWDCATRLEAFVRARAQETTVTRLKE